MRLFILVEGNDDERFFNKAIIPHFKKIYQTIKIWQHAQQSKEAIRNFVKSIEKIGADYIYVEDLDREDQIIDKKRVILKRADYLQKEKIVIVVKEIESWYLAGLDQKASKKLNIPELDQTDDIYKEKFNQLIPLEYDSSRIAIMHEILKNFSVKIACQKNESFNYFFNNFVAIGDVIDDS